MEHGIDFLQDLAVVMVVAGITTVFFHRMKQPVVLGYMLAGFLVGPHSPPFLLIQNQENINTLAKLGVIFLMFRMGLHFSLRKLFKMGAAAFLAASFEVSLMAALGYHIGRLFGWEATDSLFLGLMLSISSTTIIVKTLTDLKLIHEKWVNLVFAILIGEDLVAVTALTILPAVITSGKVPIDQVVQVIAQLAVFLAVVLVVGLISIPKILKYVSKYKEDEMLLVAVLGLVFGVSLLAVYMGYSVALGAFLVGAIMAETKEAGKIEHVIAPLRDMFSAVFFVAVGMLLQPQILLDHTLPIIVISLTVILGKIVACSAGSLLAGNDTPTSLRVGMGLAQIGEFSFIIAQMGLNLGVTSDFLYSIIVTVSAITAFTTPYLIRNSDKFAKVIQHKAPERLTTILSFYRGILEGFRQTEFLQDENRKIIRKHSLQIILNILLLTGIFIVAAWANQKSLLHNIVGTDWMHHWLAWGIAMLFSMPLVLGSLRKLQKISVLMVDLANRNKPQDNNQFFSGLIESILVILGMFGFLGWILILSLAIVPQWEALLFLILLSSMAAYLFRSPLLNIYRMGQDTLHETLTSDHTPPVKAPEILSTLFHETMLEKIKIGEGHFAIGKLIRELHLRSRVGVTVVGIERNGSGVVNPGPDEEVLEDDVLLVLGQPEQIGEASLYLETGKAA
jgi:CPA2 family monovalent cation:H+ antiporter-2